MTFENELQMQREIPASEGPILHAIEISDKIRMNSVPIFFFRKSDSNDLPFARGSGVLVNLNNYFFILTAGHCANLNFDHIVVGIHKHKHRFKLKPIAQYHEISDRGDFGYFQIKRDDAETIQAATRVFLSEKSIEVWPLTFARPQDFMLLSGYPGEVRTEEAGLIVYSTNVAGTGNAPMSALNPSSQITRDIDMWLPLDGNVETLSGTMESATIPNLHGASGGGIWRMGFSTGKPEWSVSDMRLVGTHCGTGEDVTQLGSLNHRFSRAALIGNHLAIIAEKTPDLRTHIQNTWPNVVEYALT